MLSPERHSPTMPHMPILFDKTSGPGGFNGGAEAETDSTGNAAQVVYELAPHHLADYLYELSNLFNISFVSEKLTMPSLSML